MKKFAAYVRVSDSKKQNGNTQRESIESYCKAQDINISLWVEEHISASKTDVQDRKLMTLVNDGYSIVMTDVTRLGRRKVFGLMGVIDQICRSGELHFSYTGKVITRDNCDDAETIFTIVGGSYASLEEARKRSERAKAAHARRKAEGLLNGRQPGAIVKSKLDEYAAFIIAELRAGTKKTRIVTMLEEECGVSVSRPHLYRWMSQRLM